MRSSYIAKVVYFKDLREFDGDGEGNTTNNLSEAMFYYKFDSDESIISAYDEEYRNQAEVWKVRVIVETIE
jgi:hypothetical protein